MSFLTDLIEKIEQEHILSDENSVQRKANEKLDNIIIKLEKLAEIFNNIGQKINKIEIPPIEVKIPPIPKEISLKKPLWANDIGEKFNEMIETIKTTSNSPHIQQVLLVDTNGNPVTLTKEETKKEGIKLFRGGVNLIFNEVPTGAINGSNTSFVLANTPKDGTLQVYIDGVRLNSSGWTLSGINLTTLVAPATEIVVDYQKQ